jgi:ssDNA-binding Zn-finger/Zn-ribbon topoisomerase 1
MPCLRCPVCRLRTYTAAQDPFADDCPRCAVHLNRRVTMLAPRDGALTHPTDSPSAGSMVLCGSCGLTTYSERLRAATADCPHCGQPTSHAPSLIVLQGGARGNAPPAAGLGA